MVDKGAYIALQQAFETFEAYYKKEKMKERVMMQLKNVQEENAQPEWEAMVQRVIAYNSEYESNGHECLELQCCRKKEGLPTTVNIGPVKIGEMQREKEDR